MNIVEHELKIPADYQYNALRKGNLFQKQWHRNRLKLIEIINFLHKSDCAADIGCGSGNVVLEFSNKVKSFSALDYNDESLVFLNNKLKESGIENTEVFKFDLLESDPNKFKGKFDKIILTEVIEHFELEKIIKIIKNLEIMLKRDGEILITTPNYLSFWPVMEFLVDKVEMFPKLWGEQHKVKFTKKRLRKVLEKNGYHVTMIGTFGLISPFIALFGTKIADLVLKFEVKYFKIFGPQIFVRLKKNEKL